MSAFLADVQQLVERAREIRELRSQEGRELGRASREGLAELAHRLGTVRW